MERKSFIDYFEEVEITEEYNGYFCSIAEAIGIVVLGSLCDLKNIRRLSENQEKRLFLRCFS